MSNHEHVGQRFKYTCDIKWIAEDGDNAFVNAEMVLIRSVNNCLFYIFNCLRSTPFRTNPILLSIAPKFRF